MRYVPIQEPGGGLIFFPGGTGWGDAGHINVIINTIILHSSLAVHPHAPPPPPPPAPWVGASWRVSSGMLYVLVSLSSLMISSWKCTSEVCRRGDDAWARDEARGMDSTPGLFSGHSLEAKEFSRRKTQPKTSSLMSEQ